MAQGGSLTAPHDLFPDVFAQAERARAGRRVPASLLLTGSVDAGRHTVALELVRAHLCREAGSRGACLSCSSCRRFATGHPDLQWLVPVLGTEAAKTAAPFGPLELLADPWTVADPPSGARIPVEGGDRTPPPLAAEGVRPVLARLGRSQFTPRAVFIPWADRLGAASANALLKSLEEPAPGVLWILGADPGAHLSATVRSRCALLRVPPPPQAAALEFLRGRLDDPAEAQSLLVLGQGLPGSALRLADPSRHHRAEQAANLIEALSLNEPAAALDRLATLDGMGGASAQDRQAAMLLIDEALRILARKVESVDLQTLVGHDDLRRGLENAYRAVAGNCRPLLAVTAAWSVNRDEP